MGSKEPATRATDSGSWSGGSGRRTSRGSTALRSSPSNRCSDGSASMASYDGPMVDPWAILRRTAADRDSGAAVIAREAASALGRVPRERMPEAVGLLLRGHPAMAPLWRLASDVLSALDPATGASAFLEQLARDEASAGIVARVLPDTVLTISSSSSVARAIELRRPARTLRMPPDPGGVAPPRPPAAARRVGAGLGQVPNGVREVLADAGDEGLLFLRVSPSFRVAEPPDAVHDPRELVRFEGQDPFPVVDPEGAGGVGQDVGILPPELTVFAKQRRPLLGGEQVPVRRADVGVDAQVLPGRFPPRERRDMVLGELRGPHHAHER